MDAWFFNAACLAVPALGIFSLFLFRQLCEDESSFKDEPVSVAAARLYAKTESPAIAEELRALAK
jgi:hypothetical protein